MMRRRRERGSQLVEGAIVVLLFLVLMAGILDMGQALFFHHFLNERVRAGARYAVVHFFDAGKVANFVAFNTPSPPDGATAGLFGLSPGMVQVVRYDA